MNLGQFIARVQRQIPQVTGSTVDQTQIIFELNHACDEINLLAKVLVGTVSANLPASSKYTEFSLSAMFPSYLGIDKTGIWFFDPSGVSHYVYSKTKRWLDINIRNWRDSQGSTIPQWVYIRNDIFALYPFVNVPGNIVTVDCLLKAQPMTANSNYPWTNGTTEMTTLRAFDNAIVAYAIWKLAPAVVDKEGRNYFETQFYKEVKKGMIQVHDRSDLVSDVDYIMDIGFTGEFLPR